MSKAKPIDFVDLIDLSKGLSISSMAASSDDSAGQDFIEFGLSKTYNLRIQAVGSELYVTLVPTLNPGEFAPIRIELIGEGEKVTAELVERRIHHLRQLYAISLLVGQDQEKKLADLLASNPSADIERELVSEDEKLVIQEAAPGSLILSLVAKSKQVQQALLHVCAIPFQEGRAALLSRVRSGSALKELEVQAKAQELQLKGAAGMIDIAKKIDTIKDKDTKTLIKKRLHSDILGIELPHGVVLNPYSPSPTPLTYDAEFRELPETETPKLIERTKERIDENKV